MLPGPRLRWCTRILKQEPQDGFYKKHMPDKVFVGIRADEPRRLNTKARTCGDFVYPLAEAGMDKRAVHSLCARHGLLNPVYEWRSNISCFCCFFQRKRDWLGLLQHHPDLYAVAEEWERHSALTSKQSWGWNERFTLRELREADEAQLKLWPEPEGEPCLICAI